VRLVVHGNCYSKPAEGRGLDVHVVCPEVKAVDISPRSIVVTLGDSIPMINGAPIAIYSARSTRELEHLIGRISNTERLSTFEELTPDITVRVVRVLGAKSAVIDVRARGLYYSIVRRSGKLTCLTLAILGRVALGPIAKALRLGLSVLPLYRVSSVEPALLAKLLGLDYEPIT